MCNLLISVNSMYLKTLKEKHIHTHPHVCVGKFTYLHTKALVMLLRRIDMHNAFSADDDTSLSIKTDIHVYMYIALCVSTTVKTKPSVKAVTDNTQGRTKHNFLNFQCSSKCSFTVSANGICCYWAFSILQH